MWWKTKHVNAGGKLTQDQLEAVVQAWTGLPGPQPLVTTRRQKERALKWRDARYWQLMLDEGVAAADAWRRADLEAVGWFDGFGRFCGPGLFGEQEKEQEEGT